MNIKEKTQSGKFQEHCWLVLLGLMIGATALLVGWPNLYQFLALRSMMFDIGNMSQAIWSLWRGEPLVYTSTPGGNVSRLASHAEVVYILFAPLLRVWPSPIALIVAQTLLYLSGGVAFFLLAKRRLGSAGWGVLVAGLFLGYPVGQTAALFEFHGDTLAMAFLAWALEALEARAWKRYAFWIGLALLSKVYVALPVALLGGVLWLEGRRRLGQVTSIAAILWGGVVLFGFYGWFGKGFASLKGYLALRYVAGADTPQGAPLWLWAVRLLTLVVVLGPLAWIPLKMWRKALPGLALMPWVLFTSSRGNVAYYSQHYALVVPFFLWTIVDALGQLQPFPRRQRWLAWAVGVTEAGLYGAAVLVPLVLPSFLLPQWPDPAIERRRWVLTQVEQVLPPEAPLLATPNWAAQLALRPEVYQTLGTQFAIGEPQNIVSVLPRVQYALVDGFFEYGSRAYPLLERETLRTLFLDSSLALLAQWDGVFLFGPAEAAGVNSEGCALESFSSSPLTSIRILSSDGDSVTLEGCLPQHSFSFKQGASFQGYPALWLAELPRSRALLGRLWVWPEEQPWPSVVEVRWTVPYRPGCYVLQMGWFDQNAEALAASPQALLAPPKVLGTLCLRASQAEWFPLR